MRVHELMKRDVVAVSEQTPLKEVAALLTANRISGVPVCDEDGRVVGVVSEKDILFKEIGPSPDRGGRLARLVHRTSAPSAMREARPAADAMTAPPLTIGPARPAAVAARTMIEQNVHRLPVVDRAGKLVGVLSRADLVRAFARSDVEIVQEIELDVLVRSLWIPAGTVLVEVDRGEVTVRGTVESRSTAEILPRLVERVPGVVAVRSELSWESDDLSRRGGTPLAAVR